MESEVSKWLRKRCRSAPSDGPTAKKVKFENIHEDLASRFPTKTFRDPKVVSDAIKEVFPQTYSKAAGKSRTKDILGLEVALAQGPSTSQETGVTRENMTPHDADVRDQLARERKEKMALLERVKHLEGRVQQLEQVHVVSPSHLSSDMNAVINPGNAAYHGPDTIAHFDTFSIDAVVANFNQFGPNLYQLFKSLGQCGQQPVPLDEVKVVMSLCTLHKCRSVKVSGLQLLLTLMLVARATSRQVSISSYTQFCKVGHRYNKCHGINLSSQAITVLNHVGICVLYYSMEVPATTDNTVTL